MIRSTVFICTYKARYFPSMLTESVEIGFPRSLLYPIRLQSLMFQTTVTTLLPFATVQNRNGFMPSLEKRQHSIFSSADRVKLTNGTPSSIFHILAEPSVDVETKNSESKLQEEKQQYCKSQFTIKHRDENQRFKESLRSKKESSKTKMLH
jgi:hypothetical protein